MNTTQKDTSSNPLLDGIFHLLSFFRLSSYLSFELNFITLFTTLSFHVMAGFRDPAYLNNIFIGVGTVFSWGVSIIQLLYPNSHVPNLLSFSSHIQKHLIFKKFSKFYQLFFGTKYYTHPSLLQNPYLRFGNVHLIEDKSVLKGTFRKHLFRSNRRNSESGSIKISKINSNKFSNRIPFIFKESVPLVHPS